MKNENGGCLVIIILFIPIIVLMVGLTMWTDRTLDFWCTYFTHHVVNVPMWLSFLVNCLLNGFIWVLNVVSEIARLCMGI